MDDSSNRETLKLALLGLVRAEANGRVAIVAVLLIALSVVALTFLRGLPQ